ncbi:MAG: hypothetical protein NVS2B16_25500 [Chloroflexota bacterium]
MVRYRNYWTYSVSLAIVWIIVLALTQAVEGAEKAHATRLVFLGFWIGWVSTTLARYVYPPPERWR